jgi:hypothetical protein
MFYLLSDVLFEQWKIWQSVLSVRRKSANQRRLGRWLEERTKAEKEQNSQLVYSSAAESPSDQFLTREKFKPQHKQNHHTHFFLFSHHKHLVDLPV